MGKAASIVDQLLVTHLLYTVQDLLVQQDSPVSEIVFTLFSFFFFFFFFGGPGLCISEIKNEEESLQVKPTPPWVSF